MKKSMPPAPSLFSSLLSESSSLPNDTCGSNLEYDPRFLDLMSLAQGKPEQQMGETVIAAQEADWRAVLKSATALSTETRDLRIAVILTQAAIELHGLRGLTDGLALIMDWLSHHWETLHPALEIDAEYDPLIRTNALAYLYAPHTCLKAIRKSHVLKSRIGDISVNVIEDIIDKRADSNTAPVSTLEQLTRLIADEREQNHQTFAALHEAYRLQQAIEAFWKSQLTAEYWPEFDDLSRLLEKLNHLLAEPEQLLSASDPEQAEHTAPSTQIAANQAAIQPHTIGNRREAFQVLALVRQYFERHEPAHPAPLLISRIEKLEALDFAQIIAELTPDGMTQLEQLAGQQANP